MKRRDSFLINTALLSAVNILMRTISVSFTAYITGKIGEEGVGLFTLVMSVYGLAVTVATSGVNLAAVQLSAHHMAAGQSGFGPARSAMGGCILYGALFGTGTAVAMFLGADFVGNVLLGDSRCVLSLRAMALSLPAIGVSSALAGYFTGIRKIWKNAVVSVAEQFVKIAIVSGTLIFLVPKGLEYACLGVVGGGAAAEGFSLVTSLVLYVFDRKFPAPNSTDITNAPMASAGRARSVTEKSVKQDKQGLAGKFKSLRCAGKLALPVAVGAYMRQGLLTAEHIAIPWGLRRSGRGESDALADYGVLHGMVFPILMFPSAVLGAVSTLLVPELAECKALGNSRRTKDIASGVLRLTLIFAIGVSGVFTCFAGEISEMVYQSSEAGRQLFLTAGLVPAMYLDSAVDGMLKGLGDQVYSMKVNIADSLISLALVVLLVPKMGIDGYIVVLYAAELFNLTLSLARLIMQSGVRVRIFKWIIAPFAAVGVICGTVRFLCAYPVPIVGCAASPRSRIIVVAVLYLAYAVFVLRKNKGEAGELLLKKAPPYPRRKTLTGEKI